MAVRKAGMHLGPGITVRQEDAISASLMHIISSHCLVAHPFAVVVDQVILLDYVHDVASCWFFA